MWNSFIKNDYNQSTMQNFICEKVHTIMQYANYTECNMILHFLYNTHYTFLAAINFGNGNAILIIITAMEKHPHQKIVNVLWCRTNFASKNTALFSKGFKFAFFIVSCNHYDQNSDSRIWRRKYFHKRSRKGSTQLYNIYWVIEILWHF